MNILYERIKNIYLGLFFLSPKLLSTIIFIPFLYICGWILATPIFLLGVDKENIFMKNDSIGIQIYQPLRAEYANLNFNIPIG